MLLDRRKVKFWQRIVFGGMAFLMAAFLVVGYSGVLNGCSFMGAAQSATEQINADIAKYKAAATANPDDPAAWRSLAENYVFRANQQVAASAAETADLAQAAKYYGRADKVLAQKKGAQAKRLRLDTLDQLVNVYLSMQDYQAALGVYNKITAFRPKDAQGFFNMATVALSAGDANTAILAFKKFLKLDPSSPDAPAVRDWLAQNVPSPSPTKGSAQ